MKPRVSSSAIKKWGLTPFRQMTKKVSNGDKISSILSGYLIQGDGTSLSIEITGAFEGASFAFDSNGSNLTVILPLGEVTQDQSNTVTFSSIGSLTKVNGGWLYVG